jgi:hypothetical protein
MDMSREEPNNTALDLAGQQILIILGRPNEKWTEKTPEERKELAKNLTPEQWNTLLAGVNQNSTEYLDNSIAYYTLFHSDDARLGMMATAFSSNLEYLFKAMADLAYAPRSPDTIPLLEQGIKNYPEIRQACLSTMYNLGHPVNKWHFTADQEDLKTLANLINDSLVTREYVISKLMDITEEVDSNTLVEFLMSKQLLTQDDFCDAKRYHAACAAGRLGYLNLVKKLCPEVQPSQQDVDAAMSGGFLGIIMFFETVLEIQVLPSQEAVDAAVGKMDPEALNVMCHQWQRFPSRNSTYQTAYSWCLDFLGRIDAWIQASNEAAIDRHHEYFQGMQMAQDQTAADRAARARARAIARGEPPNFLGRIDAWIQASNEAAIDRHHEYLQRMQMYQ